MGNWWGSRADCQGVGVRKLAERGPGSPKPIPIGLRRGILEHAFRGRVATTNKQNRSVYSTKQTSVLHKGVLTDHTLHDPNSGLELTSQECLGLENPLDGTDQSGRAGPALGWVIMGGGAGLTLTWHNHGQLHPPIS